MAIIKTTNRSITGTILPANLGSGTASSGTALFGDQTYKAISSYDDNKLVNDISTLALHQATNNNSAKYNLTNSNVDVYQDSSAVANLVTVARDSAGEFMSTSVPSGVVANINIGASIGGGNIVQTSPESTALTNSQDGLATTQTAYTINSSTSGYQTFDWGSSKVIQTIDIGKKRANGDLTSITLSYSTDNSTFTPVNLVNTTQTTVNYNGSQPALSNFTSSGTADWTALSSNQDSVIKKLTGFTVFTARYLRYTANSAVWGDANLGYTQTKTYTPGTATNATGNYQSTAQIANASVNKISGVVTYTNASGTATLNTDIILQVSADNGSNWTNATLTPAGTFSSGVLQAVTNDISVTAGTQLKYKIFFANQSAGSKVTRINGVSLSY